MHQLHRPHILAALGCLLILVIVWFAWARHAGPTHIGLVKFQDFQIAEMVDSNDTRMVRLHYLEQEDLTRKRLGGYDVLFMHGRGLNLSPAEQEAVRAAQSRGTRVYVFGATNPDSDMTDLEGEELQNVQAYFENGGRRNFRALLHYARHTLDGKRWLAGSAEAPVEVPLDAMFHLGEGTHFTTYEDFLAYYQDQEKYSSDQPRVALVTSVVGPRSANREHLDELITRLENEGMNVFPIAGGIKRLEFLQAVAPDLVVYLPHGRMSPGNSEPMLAWLRERQTPVLMPQELMEPVEQWRSSQQGLEGGMLTQSIVMPELDGAIEPFVISALQPNEAGLNVFTAVPERMDVFVSRVQRWLALQKKNNADKRVAIVYLKGPGMNALVASGMEVVPSLYALLKELQRQGYNTGPLPEDAAAFEARIQREGPVLGPYALGAFDEFLEFGNPELVPATDYLAWCEKALEPSQYRALEERYGAAPGQWLTVTREGEPYFALPRVQFGNVVLLPQLLPGIGDDHAKLVHGSPEPPPHPYVASYLWIREGFKADVLMHFGTHGSLEFTPFRQTALSPLDWADAMVGDLPHHYVYVINNVGEAIVAKRRSYATTLSHLTPPFTYSDLYGPLIALQEAATAYLEADHEGLRAELSRTIVQGLEDTQLYEDLRMEWPPAGELSEAEIDYVHNYLFTLAQEKITKGLYTLGAGYAPEDAHETVRLMHVDTIADARARLDIREGRAEPGILEDESAFATRYREPALEMIDALLSGETEPELLLAQLGLTPDKSGQALAAAGRPGAMDARPAVLPREGNPQRMEHPHGDHPVPMDPEEQEYTETVRALGNALHAVRKSQMALTTSAAQELASVVNALNGRYIEPSSGGDPIMNSESLPTGRNIIAIDAERTPSRQAWKLGQQTAERLIQQRIKDTGAPPEKVAITLWGGDFIKTQGLSLGTIFALLGCEPVWNPRGIVHDVRLVPIEELGRPRVDVVVQTSGQLRDVAASRIYLINKAVELASAANDGATANPVAQGTRAAEEHMKTLGLSPLDARNFAMARVFGGVNGNYGTGIMEMVEAGDSWEDRDELAMQYLKNMGAIYTKEHWGHYKPGIFEGALQGTDTLLHPQGSNVHGALSLDHMYEFMGGLNATIAHVTGADPSGYINDMRNLSNPKVVGIEESIWREARTTMLNPKYITALQEGGSSSAEVFAETFRNSFGWNALAPDAIDQALWDNYNAVYIDDIHNLDMEQYFREKNPYAYEEITAVMLESVRKGYWNPGEATIRRIAELHASLVRDHGPGCSGFVCDNASLRALIAANLSPELQLAYNDAIDQTRIGSAREPVEGIQLARQTQTLSQLADMLRENRTPIAAIIILLLFFAGAILLGAHRRRAAY